MRFTRFFFFTGIFFNCLVLQAQEHELTEFQFNLQTAGVKGKVKTITCLNYKMGSNYQVKCNEMFQNYVFDKLGNAKVVEEFIQYGSFHCRKKYSYNKENFISGYSSYDRDSTLKYSHVYSYVARENVTLTEKKGNGQINAVLNFYFDENGNRVKLHYEGREKTDRNELAYDKNKRLIEDKVFYGKEPSYIKSITYSENKVEKVTRMSNGEVYRIETTTFSEAGNKIKESMLYPKAGEEMEIVETFDRYGNVTAHTLLEKGEKTPESCYTCEYQYDVSGNWIKRTMYKPDGSVNSEVERKITYFAE